MLESDFVEGQTRRIVITDFKFIHVEMFLRFLYTEILPESYTDLCNLVKIADKYLVPELTERCGESLLNFVNLQNVYELCNLAETYSLDEVGDKCLFLIERAGYKLLKCNDTNSLSKEVLDKIVRADHLNVREEVEVFRAIWRWGNEKIRNRGMELSNENVKELIKDLLKHVRWSLMDEDETREELRSLGITVDDADLRKECQSRTSSAFYTQWFLNQCDILRLDEHASSCTLLKQCFDSTSDEVDLMHAMSMSTLPFYVVGVLIASTKSPFQARVKCSSESSCTVTEKRFESGKSLVIEDSSGVRIYQDTMCEFQKPHRSMQE